MADEQTLSELIRTLSKARVQNTFMRLSDKEVAVSIRELDTDTRERVLNLMPPGKSERIRDEMRLFSRRIVVPESKYREILTHVIAVLEGRSRGNVNSHIKPKNKKNK